MFCLGRHGSFNSQAKTNTYHNQRTVFGAEDETASVIRYGIDGAGHIGGVLGFAFVARDVDAACSDFKADDAMAVGWGRREDDVDDELM